MGYDATSDERNTTGQPLQTQALSFAGSTAKPHKASMMEELSYTSRNSTTSPHPGFTCQALPLETARPTAHGCCVPGLAVPATDLRSAS